MVKTKEYPLKTTIEITKVLREEIVEEKRTFHYRDKPDVTETYNNCIKRMKRSYKALERLIANRKFKKWMYKTAKINPTIRILKNQIYGKN